MLLFFIQYFYKTCLFIIIIMRLPIIHKKSILVIHIKVSMLNFDLFRSLKQTHCCNEVFMQVQVRITDISRYCSIHNPSAVDVSYGLLGIETQTRCRISKFCTKTTHKALTHCQTPHFIWGQSYVLWDLLIHSYRQDWMEEQWCASFINYTDLQTQ